MIVEMGGRSVQSVLERTNLTATIGCTAADCLPCRSGKGDRGNCRAIGISYEVECHLFPPDPKSKYLGEPPEICTHGAKSMTEILEQEEPSLL